MGHTVLVVPVPELEEYVVGRIDHYDPSFRSADSAFVHAHVTVLAPFVTDPGPVELDEVARLVAAAPAFDFTLDELDVFPDGTIHLVPAPGDPFAELTAAFAAAFPECPPYAGRYPAPVPHLTLDRSSATITVEAVRADLGGVLPARCRADRIALHRYANHDCRVLGEWTLGDQAGAQLGPDRGSLR